MAEKTKEEQVPLIELQPNKLYLLFASDETVAQNLTDTIRKFIEPLPERPLILVLVTSSKVIQRIITFE